MMQSVDLIWPEKKKQSVRKDLPVLLSLFFFVCLSGFFQIVSFRGSQKNSYSHQRKSVLNLDTKDKQLNGKKTRKRSKKTEFPKN